MKLMLAVALLCLSCAVAENTRVTLCGRQLAEAAALLCFGAENVHKRNTMSNYILDSSEDNHGDWLWGRGGPVPAWPRHKRQGIVDQCCMQSCTEDDILLFC